MGATFSITCWGCNKSIYRPYIDKKDFDIQINELKNEGWLRREFGPNASSWFCGEDCAYNSYHAKQAEDWWNEYNEEIEYDKYCEKAIIHPRYYGLLSIVFAAACILFILLIWG